MSPALKWTFIVRANLNGMKMHGDAFILYDVANKSCGLCLAFMDHLAINFQRIWQMNFAQWGNILHSYKKRSPHKIQIKMLSL